MIDYIKAARKLRRLLSKLKEQDPELTRVADILERLGLQRKGEHPVKQVFREASRIFRDLEVTPGLESFFTELLGEEPPKSDLRGEVQLTRALADLELARNECSELKRQLADARQERDAWHKSYLAVSSPAADETSLRALVLRYCATVVDPGSMPAPERLELFQQLLKAAKGE